MALYSAIVFGAVLKVWYPASKPKNKPSIRAPGSLSIEFKLSSFGGLAERECAILVVTNAVMHPTAKEGAILSAIKSKRVAAEVVIVLAPILSPIFYMLLLFILKVM